MANPHLCDNPGCGLCTPIRLRQRLAQGEDAAQKLGNMIDTLDAEGVTDNDMLLLDLQSILDTLTGTQSDGLA